LTSTQGDVGGEAEFERRRIAREMAEARYGFRWHLPIYVLVNGLLVTLWAYSGGGFFWPIFPLVFSGFSLFAHYWGAYRSFSGSWIDRETEKILGNEAKEKP
jgi:membrane associated rhomboid family serine protease